MGGVVPRAFLKRAIRASFIGLQIDPVARLNIKRLKTRVFSIEDKVGLTGFEPATSTPPELLHDSAKSLMSVISEANLTGNASWH